MSVLDNPNIFRNVSWICARKKKSLSPTWWLVTKHQESENTSWLEPWRQMISSSSAVVWLSPTSGFKMWALSGESTNPDQMLDFNGWKGCAILKLSFRLYITNGRTSHLLILRFTTASPSSGSAGKAWFRQTWHMIIVFILSFPQYLSYEISRTNNVQLSLRQGHPKSAIYGPLQEAWRHNANQGMT